MCLDHNRYPGIVLKTVLISGFSLVLQSCVSYGQFANTMRGGLISGQPEVSLAIAEKQDADENDVIASLDKGMLRRINNDFSGSNRIFEVAKQEIDKLYGISISENLASVTINETLRAYVGERYEQLLLHAYMAMNYIQLGQLDGARVEMLQADVKMREWGDAPDNDAFVRYLEGIIYESLGEYDDALISYRKAYIAYKEKAGVQTPLPPVNLKKDLLRLLSRQGLRNEYRRYKEEFGMKDFRPDEDADNTGELVVILNNGLAPVKSEAVIPIFSSEVQKNLRIAFPVYREPKQPLYVPAIDVNNAQYSMETVEDVDKLARYSLEQAMPGIMARATARAVIKYNTQHNAEQKDSFAGLLMTVTNLITERADTRSWTTLPEEIQLQKISLPAGEHQVKIQMLNAAGRAVDVMDQKVTIKPGQTSFVIKHWNAPIVKQVKNEKMKN